MSDNLGELFTEARLYGLVDLTTLDGGTYCCTILVALEHREMKAKSGKMHSTPSAAVSEAIQSAIRLIATVKPPEVDTSALLIRAA
jgi:hypothetical protein